MEDNKDVRKHEHSHDHSDESCSYSEENWQYGGEMCCPYIYCCPMKPKMKPYKKECKGYRDDGVVADDENMMREPMYHGGYDHHEDYGHHYGHYHYPYYPYFYPYYQPYPYYRPRPWWY